MGPEITGPDISHDALLGCVCGVLGHVFSGLSRAWPKPARYLFVGCVGGGCDGVVVWELYSGREHLVKQD